MKATNRSSLLTTLLVLLVLGLGACATTDQQQPSAIQKLVFQFTPRLVAEHVTPGVYEVLAKNLVMQYDWRDPESPDPMSSRFQIANWNIRGAYYRAHDVNWDYETRTDPRKTKLPEMINLVVDNARFLPDDLVVGQAEILKEEISVLAAGNDSFDAEEVLGSYADNAEHWAGLIELYLSDRYGLMALARTMDPIYESYDRHRIRTAEEELYDNEVYGHLFKEQRSRDFVYLLLWCERRAVKSSGVDNLRAIANALKLGAETFRSS